MFLVGAKVATATGLELIKTPVAIVKETPKQFSIGDNPVNRVIVKKEDVGVIFPRCTTNYEVSFYCFCEDADADELQKTCLTHVAGNVGYNYMNYRDMKNALEAKGVTVL